MSSAATLSMSAAVDTEAAVDAAGVVEVGVEHAQLAAVAFILATNAAMLPASQRASRSA